MKSLRELSEETGRAKHEGKERAEQKRSQREAKHRQNGAKNTGRSRQRKKTEEKEAFRSSRS